MSAAIVDGEDFDILMTTATVELGVFNAQVREVHVLVEVRQGMFERPFPDPSRVTIRVAIVIVTLPITLVEPFLVLALELVVEDHAFDLRVPRVQAVSHAQIGLVNLRVMFELALAFEAGVELLTRVLVALSVGLEQVAPTVGEDDRDVAPAVQPNGSDEPLLP